ncbi:MAG: heavy metal translocating P-type ATPase, partial [Woeseia sp.]|nr:heavy metal translocating P-type ATPase [Woeseia sp.]
MTQAKVIMNSAAISSDTLRTSITGMTCGACAVRLEKALLRAPGVESASVNFATEQADVTFNSASTNAVGIAETVAKAGFGVHETNFSFDVGGMTCSACAMRVEKVLKKVPGVLDAAVNFALERAEVRAVAGTITPHLLENTVSKAGYSTHFRADNVDEEEAYREQDA